MQKTIHIIIYNYLPLFKDGRVNRTKYFIDYLLNTCGYKVEVYTLGGDNKRIIVSDDYSINQISSNTASLMSNSRVKSSNYSNFFFSFLKRIINELIIFDVFLFKFISFKKAVLPNLKSKDIIYISVPWFSAILNILWIKQKVETIIDYRDILVDNSIFSRNFFQNRIHYFLELFLLSKTSEILVTTKSAKIKMNYRKSTIVRNGISKQELLLINKAKAIRNNESKKDLIYFGNLGNKRNAIKLFSLFNKELIDYEIYGSIDFSHGNIVNNRFKGFVDIDTLYSLIYSFKSVLIVILPEEDSENAIPGKLYQIIATGLPIVLYSDKESASKKYLESIKYEFLFIDCLNELYDQNEIKLKISSLKTDLFFDDIVIREKEYAKIKTIKC